MDYQKKLNFIMEYTRLRISQSVPKFIYEGEALALIDEIERLRQQNAELVDVLKLALASHGVVFASDPPQDAWKANGVAEKARSAITKATGGE